jgi:hypothetical protein
VWVDGTPASLVAVRQAMRLRADGGAPQLTAVGNLAKAVMRASRLGSRSARTGADARPECCSEPSRAGCRDAPCSVLTAREARDAGTWPQAVVAGVDGLAESGAAFTVARSVAERFGATLRAVAWTNDGVDRKAARTIAAELKEQLGCAADLLAAASDTADIVLVGSRGLHGLKALGSASERVAYEARSSVLVVRPAPGE